ncbi:MAG: 2'-5' RNA ligase family protein [Frankia sp.]|nr:2'-5' RNA ligase family protein [Frankia sp.]
MPRRNIGVAIEVPEPYGGELQAWRRRLGDPTAMQIPPHITLLPPTAAASERLPVVEEHLRAIAAGARGFEVELRGSGSFRPISPVTFVPLVTGAGDCERLEARVRSGPLARPLRFPYHPHVTVAQDVDDDMLERGYRELADYQARFWAWGFTLFEQGSDRHWRPQRDFPFGLGGLPGPLEAVHATAR